MSLTPAVLDAMVAAGCTAEQIVAAVKADMACQMEQRVAKRAKDAERQRKSRAGRIGHAVSHDVTVTDGDPPLSPSPLLSPHTPQTTPHPHTPEYNTPRARKGRPEKPSAEADCQADFVKRVEDHWNQAAKRTGMTACQALDHSRKQSLRQRVKEHGEDAVFTAINRLAGSEWHTGKTSGGWKASIGWFLKPQNFLKALEMPDPPDSQPARQWSDAERLEYLKSLEAA